MDWKKKYAHKLKDPDEAVKAINSGDIVKMSWGSPMHSPAALTQALIKRAPELKNVTIDDTFTFAPEMGLFGPGTEQSWTINTMFPPGATEQQKLSALDPQCNLVIFWQCFMEKTLDPMRGDGGRRNVYDADVFLVVISPPDEHGIVTFGNQLWNKRGIVRQSKMVIGEVVEDLPIILGGDNMMHIDSIDILVDGCASDISHQLYPLLDALGKGVPEEEHEASEVICTTMAHELIKDGDCISFGGGAIPMFMGPFLEHRVDLGCHTEAILPLDLMDKGVINNRRRNIVPGKTSCLAVLLMSEWDRQYIEGNLRFDMRDAELNNNPLYISQNDNMVSIMAPLEIDLFGEINLERAGPRYLRGVGGQPEIVLGALMSKGGRSIHGVASRKHLTTGEWVSNIVPRFRHPGPVAIPRHMADFIVTEHGIANLMCKTERQIANELIALAHPDFRAELRKDAEKLLGSL